MIKPNIIIPANLKIAIDTISSYICEYEKHYEMGTDSKEWQRNKRDYQNRLIDGLEVLSVVTGCEYHWTRRNMPNGKMFSGVCRAENGETVEVYDNCAAITVAVLPMARGQGEGSITELKNGMYQARVTIGYDDNGKQKRQAKYFKTKKEAKEWLTEVKAAQDKGDFVEPSKITVGEWLDIWMTEYKKRSIRPSSYKAYSSVVEQCIKPVLGKYKLKDLRHEMIQKFVNDLSDKGQVHMSIVRAHSILHGALDQAVTNGLVLKNVSLKVKFPKQSKKESMRVLSAGEQAKFIESAKGDPYGEIFIIMLATGLRIGEALVLTWNDIDFDKGMLQVNKTLTYKSIGNNFKLGVGSTKTEAGTREVPLLDSITNLLQEKMQQDIPNQHNLLFSNISGGLLDSSVVRSHFHQIAKKIGVDGVNPHTLRHTFATRGFENGIDLKVMQELLGHSSIKMTADTYTHVLADKKKDSIIKIKDTIKL